MNTPLNQHLKSVARLMIENEDYPPSRLTCGQSFVTNDSVRWVFSGSRELFVQETDDGYTVRGLETTQIDRNDELRLRSVLSQELRLVAEAHLCDQFDAELPHHQCIVVNPIQDKDGLRQVGRVLYATKHHVVLESLPPIAVIHDIKCPAIEGAEEGDILLINYDGLGVQRARLATVGELERYRSELKVKARIAAVRDELSYRRRVI